MYQAIWNGVVLAESDKTVQVEGNQYFPHDAINREYFKTSQSQTVCPWKGIASYYDIEVDGKVNRGAAWYYPSPSKAASNIKNHVAFWGGVKVKKVKTGAEEGSSESSGFLGSLKRLIAG